MIVECTHQDKISKKGRKLADETKHASRSHEAWEYRG